MPGYVMHLAVAELFFEKNGITDSLYKDLFRIGSIVADTMERSEKKQSHFWDEKEFEKLDRVPCVFLFEKKYPDYKSHPFLLGYHTHLIMDKIFVEEYWTKHFKMLDKNNKENHNFYAVDNFLLLDNNTMIKRKDFLSDQYYYGDYDIMNPYIISKYKVCEPNLESLQSLDMSQPFLEVSFQKGLPYLNKMVATIKDIKNQTPTDLLIPKTNVFVVKELCDMIEKIADNVKKA